MRQAVPWPVEPPRQAIMVGNVEKPDHGRLLRAFDFRQVNSPRARRAAACRHVALFQIVKAGSGAQVGQRSTSARSGGAEQLRNKNLAGCASLVPPCRMMLRRLQVNAQGRKAAPPQA